MLSSSWFHSWWPSSHLLLPHHFPVEGGLGSIRRCYINVRHFLLSPQLCSLAVCPPGTLESNTQLPARCLHLQGAAKLTDASSAPRTQIFVEATFTKPGPKDPGSHCFFCPCCAYHCQKHLCEGSYLPWTCQGFFFISKHISF